MGEPSAFCWPRGKQWPRHWSSAVHVHKLNFVSSSTDNWSLRYRVTAHSHRRLIYNLECHLTNLKWKIQLPSTRTTHDPFSNHSQLVSTWLKITWVTSYKRLRENWTDERPGFQPQSCHWLWSWASLSLSESVTLRQDSLHHRTVKLISTMEALCS